MYQYILKPLLFLLPPEKAHYFTLALLQLSLKTPLVAHLIRYYFRYESKQLEQTINNISFPNPVGLAAGFDKDAKFLHLMEVLGFGYIEVGTVTPKPQAGNPQPRMFRLPEDKALINRMGFNNEGVEAMKKRLQKRKDNLVVGINIGKNKVTPNEKAIDDYVYCFEELHKLGDYFVVNVSSPNTPNLRELQQKKYLQKLLQTLQDINHKQANYKPLYLKIAPDLTRTQVDEVIEVVKQTEIDGLILSNTTIDRSNLLNKNQAEKGGLSGRPVTQRSTDLIAYVRQRLEASFTIIGVGGIFTPQDAQAKIGAGANLVQVYTGLVYEGPDMVKRIKKHLVIAKKQS